MKQRPWDWIDSGTLLVAIVVGVVWSSYLIPYYTVFSSQWSVHYRLYLVTMAPVSWLLPLSVAILEWRLRSPRPRWRRLVRQPGFGACGIVSAWLIVLMVPIGIGVALNPSRLNPAFGYLLLAHFRGIGVPILGAWILLFLGGFWRPEKSWQDRAGMILGASWIALELVRYLLYYLDLH